MSKIFNSVPASQQGLNAPAAVDDPVLVEHAAEIHRLDKKPTIADVIEMGRRLSVCRPRCGHGNFGLWLDREFGWAERTAQNFMRVYEVSKSANFADLDLPLSGLYLLVAPSTPEEARDEIFERARAGEIILLAEIKDVIKAFKSWRPPAPTRRTPSATSTVEFNPANVVTNRADYSNPDVLVAVWKTSTDAELTVGLSRIGLEDFLRVMPADWRPKLGELRAGEEILSRAADHHPNRLKVVGGTGVPPPY